MKNVRTAIAEELRRKSVRVVFGLLGEDTVKLAIELERQEIAYVGARHEASAVGMADGYARISGDLGVALISQGPGVTNALSGIVTAAKGRSRVVVLAGDSGPTPQGIIDSGKHIDQELLFRATGTHGVRVDSPASAPADIAAICEWAAQGATLVANLTSAVLEAEAGSEPAQVRLPKLPPEGEVPDPELISTVADLLQESWAFRHPVILAGRGAVHAGARAELERLGDSCGALLATTVMAKGLFNGNPYDIGISGSYSTEPAVELLAGCDVVLVFGSSLDPLTTLGGLMFPSAKIIRFDSDEATAASGSVAADLFVRSDARLAAKALADELARRDHRVPGYRDDGVAAKLAGFRLSKSVTDRGRPGALDPRLLMLELDKVLPDQHALVVDNGHHRNFATSYLSVSNPNAFASPLEFHCVGAGTGVAIGAAFANRDRLTVYVVGDAGAMMTLGELETAVRLDLPLLIVVVNDCALGAELHVLDLYGWPSDIARCATPSFEALAKALGADGMTINSLDDVQQLRGRVERLERPLIVECRVTTDVRSESLDFVIGGASVLPTAV